MHAVVVGPGYTGRRVLQQLGPDHTLAVGRPGHDLDQPLPEKLALPDPLALLYTVPPAVIDGVDRRLANLLSALNQPPARVVYLSTTGVYGDRGGATVSETDPATPGNTRARHRIIAEAMLTDWCTRHEVPLYVLRVPGIYGPGRLGLDRIRTGAPVIAEAEAGPGNRIHVDDLAACAVTALSKAAPPGIYNVGDGDHRSSSWFTRKVAELATLDPPPEVSRVEAESSFSEGRLSFLRESRIVDTTKMRQVLGFKPAYDDPSKGIAASLPPQEPA